ncbi:hypothetical protein WDZ92_35050 [Nostoc sp. NIES-2111]
MRNGAWVSAKPNVIAWTLATGAVVSAGTTTASARKPYPCAVAARRKVPEIARRRQVRPRAGVVGISSSSAASSIAATITMRATHAVDLSVVGGTGASGNKVKFIDR